MFPSLPLELLLVTCAILLAAYVFRGITGFGSGLIAIPLLALFLPLTFVVPYISVVDVTASLVHGWRHRRHTAWRDVLTVLPFTVLGVVLALYLLKRLDTSMLVNALGVFVLLFAVYSLVGPVLKRQISARWSVAAGSLGGIVGTLFGTGGPLYVIYYQLRGLPKSVFRSTIATVFLIEGGIRLSGYAIAGLYNREVLLWIAGSLPLMAIGLYIGGHIHTTITQRQFQRAIGVLLIISGMALLVK
ncbi:sulfite exporter TauE/SafE family protein [Thiohalophilus sp.]|uniref:sulfite exporter TauE/SafE family protein n=1 Tax=Thiohalophilus sp. TaxID=3028392 RepID=UPI002ACE0D6F|nr:sulfite exporter TauE/SafE family protein [Thiohalophilus sp.]MDZ7805279.1 sulfite exporter TauE/SafE family protein [Thiohalophilus sp.]